MAGQNLMSTDRTHQASIPGAGSQKPSVVKTELAKSLASKWNEVEKVAQVNQSSKAYARNNAKQAADTEQVLIAGVPLRLKSSHDKETVQELVRMVDEKVRQALPLTKTGSVQNAAILAALNLAEELLLLRRHAHELTEHLEAKIRHVMTELEKSSPPV